MKKLIDFIYNLDFRPVWVEKNCIKVEYDNEKVDIILFGNYHITLDIENKHNDQISIDGCGAWGKYDVEYALEILNNREEIIKRYENLIYE